jgi:hypothetical protein
MPTTLWQARTGPELSAESQIATECIRMPLYFPVRLIGKHLLQGE